MTSGAVAVAVTDGDRDPSAFVGGTDVVNGADIGRLAVSEVHRLAALHRSRC
jgi:hypothetical protein